MKIPGVKITLTLIVIIFAISCNREQDKTLPSVVTVSVEDITPTSATCLLKVTDDGGDVNVEHGIVYSTTLHEPVMDVFPCYCGSVGGTGTFSVGMQFLTPGVTYYVRAYVQNAEGTSHGNTISFTTTGNVTGDIVFNPESDYGSVTDIEGNVYKTIQIGSRKWMAENLKTTKYNDGTEITEVKDIYSWDNLDTSAYSWFLNDKEKYGSTYGALYNWHAVNTGKLCPEGWHVSSVADWTTIEEYSGGGPASIDVFKHLKEAGFTHWVISDSSLDVTNFLGFSALPGGYRGGEPDDQFKFLGYSGWFWSSDQAQGEYYPDGVGYALGNGELSNWNLGILGGYTGAFTSDRKYGFSVRCVKNE